MPFPTCRSVLFAPANRSALLDKFEHCGADVVVADLEDGVPATDDAKREARVIFEEWARESASGPPLLLRINGARTPWIEDDIRLAAIPRVGGFVVPKAEDAHALGRIRAAAEGASTRTDFLMLAGIETGEGVAGVLDLARAGIADAMYFGAEDYVTDLGGRRSPAGLEVLYARSRVALAASIADVPAIDQVVVDLYDDGAYREDARLGRDLGYRGKMCLHPRQIPIANSAFSPSVEEVHWARRIVEAADAVAAQGHGVCAVDGVMIDAPLVARARRVVLSAE